MPSTIGKYKLFRIKHTTVLEGKAFLRNKHKTEFFEIKCTFFGRKENTLVFSSTIFQKWSKTLFQPPFSRKPDVMECF